MLLLSMLIIIKLQLTVYNDFEVNFMDRRDCDYGHIELKIMELLEKNNISKTRICKDMDIPRPNFNRYCKNEFQLIDANFLSKLLFYFKCKPEDIIAYIPPNDENNENS